MAKRIREILIIVIAIGLAYLIAVFLSQNGTNYLKSSQTYAQVLAEILAVIFILPQVIIQVSFRPQRGDIRTIFFSGLTPGYFFIYVLIIIFLTCESYQFISSTRLKNIMVLTAYLSAFFLIFPYLYFLIKEHSTTEKLFSDKKTKIIKKLKKLNKRKDASHRSKSNELNVKEKEILTLVEDYLEDVLSFSGYKKEFFLSGIKNLANVIEASFLFINPKYDYLLLEIVDRLLKNLGLKLNDDQLRNDLIERISITTHFVLETGMDNQRIGLFVSETVSMIVQLTINKKRLGNKQLVINSIKSIENIIKFGMRQEQPIIIEYYQLATALKKLAIFAIKNDFEDEVREAISIMHEMATLSLSSNFPLFANPTLTICESLTEIGDVASQNSNETICKQCVNRLIYIIKDVAELKNGIDLKLCMGNLLELVALIWINMEYLKSWIYVRLKKMKKEDGINYIKYINASRKALKEKSAKSQFIFADFLEDIIDYERFGG